MVEVTLKQPADLTVRQVVELPILAGAIVLSGESGLDKITSSVRIAPDGRLDGPGDPGTVLLIDGGRLAEDNYYIDFALRWADETDAAMVLVLRPGAPVGLASKRLATKLGLPLVTFDGDTAAIADELREQVQAPDRYLAKLVMQLVDRLGRVSGRSGVAGLLEALDLALDAHSSLVGFEGGVISGAELDPPLEALDRIPVQSTHALGDHLRMIQPVSMVAGEAPTFWLITERESPTRVWQRAASTGLQLASSYVATRLMSARIERERDARFRLGVLNSIVAFSEHLDAGLIRQIGTLGWKVDGWCSAVYIHVAGHPDQQRLLALTDDMRRLLDGAGFGAHVVERPDGWTTWRNDLKEPAAESFSTTTRSLGEILRTFANGHPGLRIYGGIGRPYAGVVGLRKSLAEAREASTIAQAGGGRTAIQHVDEMGVQRILFGWYASEEFGTFAQTLLRPILAEDREDQLLKTLEVYLDNESSPSVTGDVLGVHRNTVVNRVARIKSLLAVDLDEPDQRLAVQLACRVVHLRR